MSTQKSVMYSQQDEETHILAHTPKTGRFLDIGAWKPKDLSNTRALYERGWSGVLVEPSPGPCRELLEEYGSDDRVKIVCAAVGVAPDLKQLHVCDGPYSTTHEDTFRRNENGAVFIGSIWVPQLVVQEFINHWGPFDFVNIDVEGGSVPLLKEYLESTVAYLPQCFCIEHDGRTAEAVRIAQPYNYFLKYDNSTNLIFAKK